MVVSASVRRLLSVAESSVPVHHDKRAAPVRVFVLTVPINLDRPVKRELVSGRCLRLEHAE
jgi:hypothetical protein